MEHFIGQEDFLENNLLSPEDLRFGVDDEESRTCAAMLGIRCDRRCTSCETQDGHFDELVDANDDMRVKNDEKWNPIMEDDKDVVFSTLNGSVSWTDQPATGPKFHRSESVPVFDRTKISNMLSRSNVTNMIKKCTPLPETRLQRKPLMKHQTSVGKGTYIRLNECANDNKNLIRHQTANPPHGDGVVLGLEITYDNGGRNEAFQVSEPVANSDLGSDMLIGDHHHDGSCSPDQLTSSSSDSGLSGGEWAEPGENLDNLNEDSSVTSPGLEAGAQGSPPHLRLHEAQSTEQTRMSIGDSASDTSHDDEIRNLLGGCYTQNGVNNSNAVSHLASIVDGYLHQQQQQQPPQQYASQQQQQQQQPIHFSHQMLQQVPLVQQQISVLPNGQHQQQIGQVTCQLSTSLLQATGSPQIGVVSTNPTMFIPVRPQNTMIPVLAATSAIPLAPLQQRQDPHAQTQAKSGPGSRSQTPTQQRPLFRINPGAMSKEDALSRRRQRMIRNRESALQSRQRRKEETQSLQDEVGSLRAENLHLKDENANLKRKITELEGRLRAATSKGAVLCILGLVVMFNFGVGFPRGSSESPVLKSHIANSRDGHIPPVQRVVAAVVTEARHPAAVNSRHLLWMNETRGKRMSGLPFANTLPQGKPGCGAQWVNSTESLRVQEHLSRWASRAWASASSISQDSQLNDGLQPSAFLRRPSSFWSGPLSGFDADAISAIEEGSRASSNSPPVAASKELPLRPSWPSRALLSEVRQRNDTFYLLAFSGPPDTVFLNARQANSTSRPKIALLMPGIASATNDTIKIPPGRVAVMQIDCEVVNTTTLYIRRSLLPKNVQVAVGATQQRPHLRQQARIGPTATSKKQRRKP